MTVLAIDTTTEYGSVALRRPTLDVRNGQAVAEISLHSSHGFAHLVFGAIERLLADSRVRLEEIDCFAAANGPASFTGIRVGVAAAKGLAEALGKPAVGISNLQALASFGNLARRAVLLDARRGDVYAAVYGPDLQLLVPEMVMKAADWLSSLPPGEYQFISPLGPKMLEGTRFAEMPFVDPPRYQAAAVAYCAELQGGLDPAAVDANYVRHSDAELFWKVSP